MAESGYPCAYTAHVDTFARDNLPPAAEWPSMRFELPELQYPERLNCATALLDNAIREGHGERIVLYADSGNWTWRQLQAEANCIAQVLVSKTRLVPGNRVLLRGFNSPMLVAAWFAVMKAGGIAVTTMPMLRTKELQQIIGKAEITHALCDARLTTDLEAAGRASGHLRSVLAWGNGVL
ncbi:MAG TPA: AMP-binding protein, partial [Steroidobacteraceae bacterium]|nr:AMP-binding protein [Steroidobacteraceae bacterium]